MEHFVTHTSSHSHPEGNQLEKWKSCSVEPSELSCGGGGGGGGGGGFDCNICLDSVQDPVLTLCGHLYCWPCIYKWIHLQSVSHEVSEQQPLLQCPVCKSEVSESTLVPLYGRDSSMKRTDDGDENNSGNHGLCIPRRPKGPLMVAAAAAPTTTSNGSLHSAEQLNNHPGRPSTTSPYHPPYYGSSDEYTASFPPQAQAISFAGSTTFHPVISMFGKMISPRSFGDHQMFSANPTSYNVAATSDSRGRRQVVHAHRSLSRLSLFLWCCLLLCLILF